MRSPVIAAACLLVLACGEPTRETPPPADPDDAQGFAAVELFQECAPDAPALELPPAIRDSIVARIPTDYVDGQLAAVARRVPGGFGGMWRTPAQQLVAGLVDTTQATAALAALGREPMFEQIFPASVTVTPVRWTFAQLVEWSYFLEPTIWAEPDLVTSDRDELRNRIVLGVTSEAGRDRLVAALRRRGDVPCRLIVVEHGRAVTF